MVSAFYMLSPLSSVIGMVLQSCWYLNINVMLFTHSFEAVGSFVPLR